MKRVVCLGARLFLLGFITRYPSKRAFGVWYHTLFMRNGTRVALFRCRHFRSGLTDAGCHHTGTRVQQLASFTMHTGLAEQPHTYLLKPSAFPTCYFSLGVSTPGRLGVLEVFALSFSCVTQEFHMHRHGAQPHPGKHLASFDANFLGLDMVGRHIPAWHQGFMHLLAVLACSSLPVCSRVMNDNITSRYRQLEMPMRKGNPVATQQRKPERLTILTRHSDDCFSFRKLERSMRIVVRGS